MSDHIGKNFSRNRPRADRLEADFYQTPHCLTHEFLMSHAYKAWPKNCNVADFCCGKGAIQDVLIKHGFFTKFSNDLMDGFDFFALKADPSKNIFEYGLMNPPFRLFNKWAEHCFEIFSKEFVLLGPTTYQQGLGRFNADGTGIFQQADWVLSYVYTFNRYPMLTAELRSDGFIETGMQALSWYVWRKRKLCKTTDTVLRWLDIDRYVLRKRRIIK
jgi:hypothetical protein